MVYKPKDWIKHDWIPAYRTLAPEKYSLRKRGICSMNNASKFTRLPSPRPSRLIEPKCASSSCSRFRIRGTEPPFTSRFTRAQMKSDNKLSRSISAIKCHYHQKNDQLRRSSCSRFWSFWTCDKSKGRLLSRGHNKERCVGSWWSHVQSESPL